MNPLTDVNNPSITVRILVSARNSGDLWDLRCFVREAALGFLREGKSKISKAAEDGLHTLGTVQDEPRK